MTWFKFEYLVTRFEFRQLRLLVHRLVPGEAFALSNVRIVGLGGIGPFGSQRTAYSLLIT
jgi:hypothetical protein